MKCVSLHVCVCVLEITVLCALFFGLSIESHKIAFVMSSSIDCVRIAKLNVSELEHLVISYVIL